MIVITKNTVKMLRYIKRKGTPQAFEIMKRFLKDDNDFELINLCIEGYLLCIKDDGTYTNFIDEPLITSSTYKYWATPLTDKYLEDKDLSLRRWMYPTILSLVSLVLSVITFLYTVIDKSPTLVKILK